jgi:NADH dehydrogenase
MNSSIIPESAVPHVVIIGGGFGGLHAAQALRRANVRITMFDRRNHHLFQPLLYQVATAGLNPADIAVPIRSILRRQRNVTVLLGEVLRVDAANRTIILGDGEAVTYDYLIVATGATHSYFGHDEWAPIAPGLKSVEDALDIRRRVLLAFEAAEREDDESKRRALLTFVVIGGGPTGVELAGALAEIAHHTLARDFRNIDPASSRVLLLEGLPRILQSYPESLSASAVRQLEHLQVTVRTNTRVTNIDAEGVSIGDERIEANTVLWAAGVRASPLLATLGTPLDRAGRAIVESDLSIPRHANVFIVGDAAAVPYKKDIVPGVAPAAMQEGSHTARNIERAIAGAPSLPFRYRDKGSMATIGRAAAVADIKGIQLSGFLAWMAWLVIHVISLIGFRNRLLVLVEWTWAYLSFTRGARLITGEAKDREIR